MQSSKHYKVLVALVDNTMAQLNVLAVSERQARIKAEADPLVSYILRVEEDFTGFFADICAGRV
jgi:hypothetical protein